MPENPDIGVGTTFRLKNWNGDPRHLFVVIAGPSESGKALMANFTTYGEYKDGECILEIGDHPFILHKTVVKYDASVVWPLGQLASGISAGALVLGEPASEELLERIIAGFWKTGRVSTRCHDFARENMTRPESPRQAPR